jgi:hypothetical protein
MYEQVETRAVSYLACKSRRNNGCMTSMAIRYEETPLAILGIKMSSNLILNREVSGQPIKL